MTASRRVLGAVALAIAVAAAGCGVPIDGSPQALDTEELPLALRLDAPVPTTAAEPNGDGEEVIEVTIWLVQPGASEDEPTTLTPAQRPVESATLVTALEELFAPLTEAEIAGNRTSQLANLEQIELLGVAVDDGVATITLSDTPPLDAPLLRQFFAQMVFTAVEFDTVDSARFRVGPDGDVVAVPVDGGGALDEVGRLDYPTLDPANVPQPATTTTRPD